MYNGMIILPGYLVTVHHLVTLQLILLFLQKMSRYYKAMIAGGNGLMRKFVVTIPYMLPSLGGVHKLPRRWKCCVRRKVSNIVKVTCPLVLMLRNQFIQNVHGLQRCVYATR